MTEIPSAEEWAAWIKARRQALGLSQAAVAELLDLSVRTVLYWEKAKVTPKQSTRAGVVAILSKIEPVT